MDALTARTALKSALTPSGVAIKFRGEVLPLETAHAVIDLIVDTPIVTWSAAASQTITRFQVGYYAKSPFSNAAAIYDACHPLAVAAGFNHVGNSRFVNEDNWTGIIVEYQYSVGG